MVLIENYRPFHFRSFDACTAYYSLVANDKFYLMKIDQSKIIFNVERQIK